jgi:hypothetical protein
VPETQLFVIVDGTKKDIVRVKKLGIAIPIRLSHRRSQQAKHRLKKSSDSAADFRPFDPLSQFKAAFQRSRFELTSLTADRWIP